MKSLSIISILIAATTWANADSHQSSPSNSHYIFMSGKISAQVKDTFHQVKAFDGKRLHLDGDAKPVRPTKDLACSMRPNMVVSNLYADIGDFEYAFESNAEKLRTLEAINELSADQMRFEAGTEFENMLLFRAGTLRTEMTEHDEAAAALNELTQNQIDDEFKDSDLSARIDTVRGRCSLIPNRTIENAYAALVMSFEGVGANEESRNKGSIVRIIPVGDLQAGAVKRLKFNSDFPELLVSRAKLDLFLYDGKSKYVGTNLSRGLKEISTEELERLRERERLKKEKAAAQQG